MLKQFARRIYQMLCLRQMISKHNRRLRQAAGLIAVLSLQTQANCVAQTSPKSGVTVTQPAQKGYEKPFDRLELFCFFAAGPVATYAKYVLQERGADFTPDADFVSSFSSEVQRDILRGVRPRSSRKAAPVRDQAFELVRKAYQDQRQHLYPTASNEYQKAMQLAPDSATLHLAYAGELLFAHDFPHADEQAHISLNLWPTYAEAHGMLALSMVLQKRSAEAETESKETLRIFPGHVSAKFTLAQALTNEYKYREAIPAIRTAMTATPSMTALTKFLGIALLETGDTVGGIEELATYVKKAPDDAEGHYYYGKALKAKGEREQARAQFAEAARLQPNNSQFKSAAEN
jgi:predicted Zn-dependent protease